jgi:hypothetical protein
MIFKNILKKLNIREDESNKVGLLIIQSIFIGIFLSFYNNFSSTLFLATENLGFAKLPEAYIYSGILGFIFSYIFSKFQKKLNPSKLLQYFFLVIILLFISIKIGLIVFEDKPEYKIYLIYFSFIVFVPISVLTGVGFGSISLKMFDLRQGKRLFSIITTGEVISSLIAYSFISFLQNKSINKNDDTSFLLYFVISGALLAFVFQSYIGKKYADILKNKISLVTNIKSKISFSEIINNKYYLSIIILSIVSVISFMFINFSFLKLSKGDGNQKELSAFLALVYAIIKTMELIFKTFISGRVIEKYGLKLGLGILPTFLIPTTLIIVSSFYFEFKDNSILIFAATSFILAMVFKKAFEGPTFSLLFLPLDSQTKISLQTLVNGKAKLFAPILAGIILNLVVDYEDVIQIISMFLVIMLTVWLYTVNKVGYNYKSLISRLLKERKGKSHQKFSETNYLHSFELLRKRGNPLLHKHFTQRLIPGFQQIKLLENNLNNRESLEELINSKIPDDHIKALAKINNNWDTKYVNFVCSSALSDSILVSKGAIAILSSRKIDKVYIDTFLNSMVNPTWSVSMFFLLNIGYNYFDGIKKIDLNIERGADSIILKTINEISLIQILGENNNQIFTDFFFKKMRDTDSEVETHLLKSLSKRKLAFTEFQKVMLRAKIDLEVKHYCWVLSSILDLYNDPKFEQINLLLYLELDMVQNRLYLILGLLYKTDEINQIQSALKGNEAHEIVLAMEMLENILDEGIKEFITPVFDTIEIKPKYDKLVSFFPQIRMSPIKRLENITNYDFKRSITLLRIVAIKKLCQFYEGTNDAIIANTFNQNEIIKEAAYLSLFKNNKKEYLKYYKLETDVDFKKRLDFFTSNKENISIEEKVELLFSNNFFPHTSRLLLFKIAYFAELNLDNYLDNKILKDNDYVIFVISGEIKLISLNKKPLVIRKGGILGLKTPIYEEKTISLDCSEGIQYLRIPAAYLNKILITEPLLVSSLLNYFPSLRILKRKKML